jgi:hypothetical protein
MWPGPTPSVSGSTVFSSLQKEFPVDASLVNEYPQVGHPIPGNLVIGGNLYPPEMAE